MSVDVLPRLFCRSCAGNSSEPSDLALTWRMLPVPVTAGSTDTVNLALLAITLSHFPTQHSPPPHIIPVSVVRCYAHYVWGPPTASHLRRLPSHHIPLPRAEIRHLAAAWYMEIGCIGLEKHENVIGLEQFFCSLGARRRDRRRVCGARGRRDGV